MHVDFWYLKINMYFALIFKTYVDDFGNFDDFDLKSFKKSFSKIKKKINRYIPDINPI